MYTTISMISNEKPIFLSQRQPQKVSLGGAILTDWKLIVRRNSEETKKRRKYIPILIWSNWIGIVISVIDGFQRQYLGTS